MAMGMAKVGGWWCEADLWRKLADGGVRRREEPSFQGKEG